MNQIAAVPSTWNSEKLSGWAMNIEAPAGIATPIAAAIAIRGLQPISRAINQVRGAASDPISAKGRAEASGLGPSSHIDGNWTIDARGIQNALLGIGSPGWPGILPPTSMNE